MFDRIGPDKLRAVLTDFYSRVFGDVMIGFLFEGKNRQQLIDREYEFTANLLGADVKYTGRPMRTAHGHLPIFGGHFERRMQILRETLRDHAVDPEVQRVWLEHSLALRPQITPDRGSECKDTSAVKLGAPNTPPQPEAPVKVGRRK
jgi:hemoglobin